MTIETGGPAFPCEGGNKFISGNEIRRTLPSSGMTLRDYFAAKAMQTLLSRDHLAHAYMSPGSEPMVDLPRAAWAWADAMLAARTK